MANIINKVVYAGNTLIDLTGDTVEQNKVLSGYTFHDKSGATKTGNCTYDANTSDATASASEILATKTAYVAGSKVTGSMTNNGAVTGTISTKAQEYTVPVGYHDGSGKVSIASAEQSKIIAGNIKSGITILGVVGTYSGEAVDGIEAGGGSAEPNLQAKTYTVDSAGTETITADGGYDGLSEVEVSVPEAAPYVYYGSQYVTQNNSRKWQVRGICDIDDEGEDHSGYIGLGSYYGNWYTYSAVPANTTVTPTTSSQTIGGANYMMEGAVTVSAMPSGTAGTPTATKGAVSNHSVSVTPSVTNTTGYITGSTKTGTAVTVSASELVSGDKAITSNGNNIDVANYSTVSVNVSGGTSKNTQVVQGTTRTTSSTQTAIGAELTVSKTGTYDVYWSGFRSTTSGSYTYGTQLFIDNVAYGTENTTWSNHIQNNHLSNVSLTENQKIRVRGRNSRGSSYYIYAPTLVIVEA